MKLGERLGTPRNFEKAKEKIIDTIGTRDNGPIYQSLMNIRRGVNIQDPETKRAFNTNFANLQNTFQNIYAYTMQANQHIMNRNSEDALAGIKSRIKQLTEIQQHFMHIPNSLKNQIDYLEGLTHDNHELKRYFEILRGLEKNLIKHIPELTDAIINVIQSEQTRYQQKKSGIPT